MQKIICLIVLVLAGSVAMAQNIPAGSCGLLYKYDAAGNCISREYFCNNTDTLIPMRKDVSITAAPQATEAETSFAKVDALYPNPTTGKFTIRFANALQHTQINITDVNGRTIQQLTGNGFTMEFDLSNRPAGVYYVVIRNGKESIVQKVIKQ